MFNNIFHSFEIVPLDRNSFIPVKIVRAVTTLYFLSMLGQNDCSLVT